MHLEWHVQERHLLTLESPFSRLWTQRVRVDPLGAHTVHVSIIDTEENPDAIRFQHTKSTPRLVN